MFYLSNRILLFAGLVGREITATGVASEKFSDPRVKASFAVFLSGYHRTSAGVPQQGRES